MKDVSLTRDQAFEALELINSQHRVSIYGADYCSCGTKIPECAYILMLRIFDTVLSAHVQRGPVLKTITEYGYLYEGKPMWSIAGDPWDYSKALKQLRNAELWGVPDEVGGIIERTVDIYESNYSGYRRVGTS